MDIRPVLYVSGMLLSIMSLSLILPMLADLYVGHSDWKVFFLCIIVTAFFGGSLVLSNAGQKFKMSIRQVFFLTFTSWMTIVTFGALPFRFSELNLSFTDAFFESMSGITTTGATVITGLDDAPPGILLWRAILQWLGGIGIILMAMSVMPFLKVGGMQIFRTELSESEKALPREATLASAIGLIYLGLTILCAILYMMTGLTTFDAIAHAMTTISTGGFSTFDTSFGHYNDPWAEIVAIVFMLLGGMPFVLYLKAVRGNIRPFIQDSQVRWFLSIVAASIVATTFYLVVQQDETIGEALRRSSFNIISLITGTGYVNGDYNMWGGFVISLFFFLMVVGGCAGSTSCGIKIFRFQVLYAVTHVQMQKLLHPHGVFIAHYNNKPIPPDVPMSVMSFFFVYAVCFSLLAIALSFVGLDFLTAMSGAATAISNVGPGLGDIIGPTGTFAPLPDDAKWILSAGMLLGRLEIFTILVMLSPKFWRP
ncbi:MAG: TrkH family potassium uptake protein [Alphaproteobacteria bacterium]|nr:TrkH family potassium uptake protein [Alphaproteobacteria bacterium]